MAVSRRLIVRTLSAVALGAACLACGCRALSGLASRFRTEDPEFIAAYRDIARQAETDRVAFLCEKARAVSPIERTKLAALAWELSPSAAAPVDMETLAGFKGELVVSAYVPARLASRLSAMGFAQACSNEFAVLWRSADKGGPPAPARTPAWLSRDRFADARLPSPNGFAVYAGKARLMMMSGGVPEGFFTSPAYAVCQPFYPPGMALLAALPLAVSSRHLDLVLSSVVALLMLLLAWRLASGDGRLTRGAMALLMMLSPVGVGLACGFYAEPAAALMIACGSGLIAKGKVRVGLVVAGLAALFRPEGLALAFALWAASVSCVARSKGSFAESVVNLVICISPGVLWMAFALSQGAGMQDVSFLQCPSVARMSEFVCCVAKANTAGFAEIGILPLVAFTLSRAQRRVPFVVFCAVALLSGTLSAGFNASPYYSWVLDNCVPRYSWMLAAALPLLSCKLVRGESPDGA